MCHGLLNAGEGDRRLRQDLKNAQGSVAQSIGQWGFQVGGGGSIEPPKTEGGGLGKGLN